MKKKDLLIKAEMVQPIPDYDTKEVAEFIEKLSRAGKKLFIDKDTDYDGSWQNRGLFSVQANFERKVDRINSQFYNQVMVGESNENISDTLIDLSMYSFMYLFYLYKTVDVVKEQVDKFLQSYLEK